VAAGEHNSVFCEFLHQGVCVRRFEHQQWAYAVGGSLRLNTQTSCSLQQGCGQHLYVVRNSSQTDFLQEFDARARTVNTGNRRSPRLEPASVRSQLEQLLVKRKRITLSKPAGNRWGQVLRQGLSNVQESQTRRSEQVL